MLIVHLCVWRRVGARDREESEQSRSHSAETLRAGFATAEIGPALAEARRASQGRLERAHGRTLLLVVQPCPPLFGVFLSFLGPGSMPFLQVTPRSWLLSITLRKREGVSVPWPALSLNSFTHRERYSVLLKHHGTQAAQLILGSDSWPCKWNIKHLSLIPTVCSRHTAPQAAFPLSWGFMPLNLLLLPQPSTFLSISGAPATS